MSEPQYKRALSKLSSETLAEEASRNLDFGVIGSMYDVTKRCVACGAQIGIMVGGGNFWHGVEDDGGRMKRARTDHIGMLAATVSALAAIDVLEQKGVDVRVRTAIEMRAIVEPYIRSETIRYVEEGRITIFDYGTDNPFFSTSTAAVLRAAEIDTDAIPLVKNIDDVYSTDPKKDPSAVKYGVVTYNDMSAQYLRVMSSIVTSPSMDNKIPVVLFALKDLEDILWVVMGEKAGIIVKEEPWYGGSQQGIRCKDAEGH